jgi:lysophospholipase L1-like esterase
MKRPFALLLLLALSHGGCEQVKPVAKGQRFVPASNPALQYSGRWDRTDTARPKASWPGFAVAMNFRGKSIHVRMNDQGNYYNIEVDGKILKVIGGRKGKHLDYLLAEHLSEGDHRIRIQRRNINFNEPTEIEGFVVDDKAILTSPDKSTRSRIEFIGDSYTVAEGNEAKAATLAWDAKYPLTNFAKGYASQLAGMMNADVTAVSCSGSGVLCNWKGDRKRPMGERYGWTLMESPAPAWTYNEPEPELVVISLGLNDFSGLKSQDDSVSPKSSEEFRTAYQKLIRKVVHHHPEARILALAPSKPWARENIAAVVKAEREGGNPDIFYAEFDDYPGGYVANGHPTVETHQKIASGILAQLKVLGLADESGSLRAR